MMREIVHRSLTRLVGLYGINKIGSKNLKLLEFFSIEPDEKRKNQLRKGIREKIVGLFGWFSDHTRGSKELSIKNLIKAHKTYKSGDRSWVKYLGRSFHYIADCATPYHSVKLISKYILTSENVNLYEESSEGRIIRIILDLITNPLKLIAEHNRFEKICEKRWQEIELIIRDKFVRFTHNKSLSINLGKFNKLMDDLHLRVKDLSANWANNSSNQEFAIYMTRIAIVMEVACRLVFERG